MAAARPRPELAPVMTAVGFCCSFGTSVLDAERAPEVTAGAAATACATTEAPREGAEEAEEAAAMDFLSCLFERAAEAEAEAATTLLVLGAAQAEKDCETAPRREATADDPRAEEKDCIVSGKEREKDVEKGGRKKKKMWRCELAEGK